MDSTTPASGLEFRTPLRLTRSGSHPLVITLSFCASARASLSRNQLAIQLLSFFFESIQWIFKVPASVNLTYKGFEVSFSTDSIPWKDVFVVGELADDEDGKQVRKFEMMPTPSNAALHWYIRDPRACLHGPYRYAGLRE